MSELSGTQRHRHRQSEFSIVANKTQLQPVNKTGIKIFTKNVMDGYTGYLRSCYYLCKTMYLAPTII